MPWETLNESAPPRIPDLGPDVLEVPGSYRSQGMIERNCHAGSLTRVRQQFTAL
jgi:hypothetical protein